MDIKQAIKAVVAHQDLDKDDMIDVMQAIMSGETSDMLNAAFLVGLQTKGVKASEILGGATVMRKLATPVNVSVGPHLVDTCGTGGSGSNKFNVSTAAAIVAACSGAYVAKHGNRGATSKSGSADVLEAAGVKLDLTPEQVAATIDEVGVGFMFAPAHHSAMKHVIAARKEVGLRTIFNLLGPLTNPAGAPNQLMGVYDQAWIEPLLEVFKELGSRHVLVVSSDDGLDEISISAPTMIGELKQDKITVTKVQPKTLGIAKYKDYSMLQIDSAEESLEMIKAAFVGSNTAARDMVAINAGAAIYAANLSDDLVSGVEQAREILDSGAATGKLAQLVTFTQEFGA